jgi:hypothetical protein
MLWAALCITANSDCRCPLRVKSRHCGISNLQKQTFPMSALPPKADIGWPGWDVRFVPKADIGLTLSIPRLRSKARPPEL